MNDKKTRTRYIQIRLTDDEYAQIGELASRALLTRSEYIRRAAFNMSLPASDIDTKLMRDLKVELSRQGNNINQIAKIMNQGADEKSVHGYLIGTLKAIKQAADVLANIESR